MTPGLPAAPVSSARRRPIQLTMEFRVASCIHHAPTEGRRNAPDMLACGVLANVQRRDLRTLELSRRRAAGEIGVDIKNSQVVAQRQTRSRVIGPAFRLRL